MNNLNFTAMAQYHIKATAITGLSKAMIKPYFAGIDDGKLSFCSSEYGSEKWDYKYQAGLVADLLDMINKRYNHHVEEVKF